jgi:hypothetical protein
MKSLLPIFLFVVSRIIQTAGKNSNALVLLGKGGAKPQNYAEVIRRTKAIASQPWSGHYDHIFFHEGNVDAYWQNYVNRHVQPLVLKFVSVAEVFRKQCRSPSSTYNKAIDLCPRDYRTTTTSCGYKTMCYFWFIAFTRYLPNYKSILRVDDDCVLAPDQRDPIEYMRGYDFGAFFVPKMDRPGVMRGMISTFDTSASNFTGRPTQLKGGAIGGGDGWVYSPYTNVMWMNMSWVKSPMVRFLQKAVSKSGCIHAARWGDAPLWGVTVNVTNAKILMSMEITYHHSTHHCWVGHDIGNKTACG